MKSIFDELSVTDRQNLSRLYETDMYKSLKKAIELCRVNAAKFALDAPNWEEVKHLQGQAHGLKQLHRNIKELNKSLNKD